MALEEASKYLTGDWTEEIKCFNCFTLIKYSQEDIVDYQCMGHFGVQCSCCKFPLELSDVLPPIVLQRSWKILSDLKFDPCDKIDPKQKKRISWAVCCRTCRSKIRFYPNHVGHDITCPACSHEAGRANITSVGQKFENRKKHELSKYTYFEAWVLQNNKPNEVIELSPFVTNEWSVKKQCSNCKSDIIITAKSETVLGEDFMLKARCEGCDKLMVVNKFNYHDKDSVSAYTFKHKLIFDHYYLSASNYDLKKEFPPVIFWKIYERQGGTYTDEKECVIL